MDQVFNTPAQVGSSSRFPNACHRSDVQHRNNHYRFLSFCSVLVDADHSGEKLLHHRGRWKHQRLVLNGDRLLVGQ